MSRFFATVGMMAFLASPALGQFTIEPGSTITIGLATSLGGGEFAVDSSPLAGTFEVANGGGPSYAGVTHLDAINAANTAAINFVFGPLLLNTTTLPGEFQYMGFNAPSPVNFFSADPGGVNPGGNGVLAGGPPASGAVLTEVLARLRSNGSLQGGPVTLDTTAWIPPLDASSIPSPFIVTLGAEGTLASPGGGPDDAKIDANFWVDLGGGIFAHFTSTVLGSGRVTPEPATMSLLGLGGLALIRRVRRRRLS